jgi:hypothetical protein
MAVSFSRSDLIAGGIFIVIGAGFSAESLNYEMGTVFRMGPGFMPLTLGIILAVLGLAVMLAGRGKPDAGSGRPVPWRAVVLIVLALAFFGATVRQLGLMPVAFATSLLTAFASREASPLFALIVAVALTALCTAVFHYGLGLTIPLFGPWMPFLGVR